MDRKLNEFLALTQGNRTVLQYAKAFNDLCPYARYHADTDEKKRDRFRRGLGTKLRDRLNTVRANSYNDLVNMAVSQEDCITTRQAEKKRKTPVAGPSAQPQRFRIVSDTQNRLYKVVVLSNKSLHIIDKYSHNLSEEQRVAYEAEVRALRALFYYVFYGRHPFRFCLNPFVIIIVNIFLYGL